MREGNIFTGICLCTGDIRALHYNISHNSVGQGEVDTVCPGPVQRRGWRVFTGSVQRYPTCLGPVCGEGEQYREREGRSCPGVPSVQVLSRGLGTPGPIQG